MSEVAETISFVGECLFKTATLITHNGTEIDISALIAETSLYEDLFSPTMSGSVIIEDANDLITTLPLIGQERLILEFRTPTLKTSIKKTFYVYKLHARSSKKRVQRYILSFCTFELIQSQNKKISRAFSGKISDTVNTIFRDPYSLGSDSTLYIEPTKNSYEFIAAYWTPIETINWLANRSINESGVPNYLFFETNQSFEFVSMDRLIKSEPIREYVFTDTDASTIYGVDGDIDKKYSVVEKIDTPVTFDYLRSLIVGMYSSKLATLDLTTKNINVSGFDYVDDFSKSSHLEANPLTTSSLARSKNAVLNFVEKNNYLHGNFQKQGHSDYFLQRNSLMRQLSAFKLCIQVPGRTDIKVGNTIKFVMPKYKELVKSDRIESDYYQGKYLISAIKHTFTSGSHSMLMEIVSDSFFKAL